VFPTSEQVLVNLDNEIKKSRVIIVWLGSILQSVEIIINENLYSRKRPKKQSGQ